MATKNKAPKITEAHIQQACVQLLELDGWRPLRTDPVSDRSRGKGFGEKGMADHLFIRYKCDPRIQNAAVQDREWAQVLWVEFKRPGNKATQHQKDWHVLERAYGALTWIAGEDFPATVDGFLAHYKASGLSRGRI